MAHSLARIDPYYPNRPWTVCFYGARAGAGCTTLLVNTALRGCGERGIFLLDLNLADPGIDQFDACRPPRADFPGLVEYVRAYRETGSPADLRDFVYPGGPKRKVRRNPILSDAASPVEPEDLPYHERYVMRAGLCDDEYRPDASVIDWRRFLGLDHPREFFENLRAAVLEEFNCEFMLIDAPSGISEIGGLSTSYLADAVVFVIEPTRPSLRFLPEIIRQVKNREQTEGRRFPRLYVASKAPMVSDEHFQPEPITLVLDFIKKHDSYSNWQIAPEDLFMDSPEDPDFLEPTFHIIRERHPIRKQTVPDDFLVLSGTIGTEAILDVPSAVEMQYATLSLWLSASFSAVVQDQKNAEVVRKENRKYIRVFAQMDMNELNKLMQKKAVTDFLRECPSELLALLRPDCELAVRRRLAELRTHKRNRTGTGGD